MKAYKLLEDKFPNWKQEHGRYFVEFENQAIMLATPTLQQTFISLTKYDAIKRNGTEYDVESLKWLHPHLYKPIKQFIK